MRIITLLTDFGSADPFVGVMKGVILGINPQVELVDLCHGVSPHDVLEAAFLLHASYRYFPPGTIHLVVVDPGVGGSRRPLLAEGTHGYYLAPDNGVLSYLYASGEVKRVLALTEAEYFLHPVSRTFHGRDIFAPVAAHLSRIGRVDAFGGEVIDYVKIDLPVVEKMGRRALIGSVLHVDRFGNLITNISEEEMATLPRPWKIRIGGETIQGLASSYDRTPSGVAGAIIGSAGTLEVFINRGSAAKVLQVKRGEVVRVETVLHRRRTRKAAWPKKGKGSSR